MDDRDHAESPLNGDEGLVADETETGGLHVSRRGLLGLGTLPIIGAFLARLGLGEAHAASQAGGPISPSGTMVVLSPETAAAYYTQNLLENAVFQKFHKHLTAQGFKFMAERVQVAVGVRPAGAGEGVGPPYLLAIVPSFKPASALAPSHDVASIVVLRQLGGLSITAALVTVQHRPYQLASFSLAELDKSGAIVTTKTSARAEFSKDNTALAKAVGAARLPVDPAMAAVLVGPSEADSAFFASLAFRTLTTDKFSRPLYPPDGLQAVLRDAPLVQRWAAVTEARYTLALGGARTLQGGTKVKISGKCTSSSTSSHGCTSTSSSVMVSREDA